MKKISILVFGLWCTYVQARDVRVPLMNLQFGAAHYPFFGQENEYKPYTVDVWTALYSRIASSAFSACDATCTVPYSTLIFGTPDFTLKQIFAESTISIPNNPFVNISMISPSFSYEERAAIFGLNFVACVPNTQWHMGFKVRLPIRDIQIKQTCENKLMGETLEDVYQERMEIPVVDEVAYPAIQVFAARLDFLTALNQVAFNAQGQPVPMVNYADPDSPNGTSLTIASYDTTGQIPAAGPLTNNNPPVAVIDTADGSMPSSVRWGDVNSSIASVVAGDGLGVDTLARGRFANDINYLTGGLGIDQAAQKKLFVVPTVNNTAPNKGQKTSNATAIMSTINTSINEFDTANDFIITNNLNFCGGNAQGLGDLDIRVFGSRNFCNGNGFGEIRGTIRLPTGSRLKNCKDLIKQATGNNGHIELMLGGAVGYTPCNWFHMSAQGDYSYAVPRQEFLAAPFAGATVKNIGPCVCGSVSWSYFLGALDITFTPACNFPCGFDLGYVFFAKSQDKICLLQETAIDFVGIVQPLNSSVLTKNTNELVHRIRTEFFTSNDCADLFIGFSYTFAGKNAPRETDWYIGLDITF